MSTKVKIILWASTLIIVLGLISSWFYWFQWRPDKALKDCKKASEDYYYRQKEAELQLYKELGQTSLLLDNNEISKLTQKLEDEKNKYYDDCMFGKGFKQ